MSKIELITDYLDDERLIYISTVTRDGELLEDVYEYWAVLADWQAGNRERALRRSNLAEAFGTEEAAELLEVFAPRWKELLF